MIENLQIMLGWLQYLNSLGWLVMGDLIKINATFFRLVGIQHIVFLIRNSPLSNMSDRERIATLDFFKKEHRQWFARESSESLAKNMQFAQKRIFCMFLTVFLPFMPKSESLPLLFAQSLFTKEWPWAICSRRSWQKSDGSDSLFFTSVSLFRSQKMSNSLEKQMSEFPTLSKTLTGPNMRIKEGLTIASKGQRTFS